MSWETSTYVLGCKVGSATKKLVLMGYANHASKDGRDAFPSLETIAEYAECDKRTVQRHVKALVAEGWMREGDQQLVAHRRADQRPIVYDIAMTEETRRGWQIEHEAGGNTRREAATAAGLKGAQVRAEKAAAERGDEMSRRSELSNLTERGDEMSRRSEAERGDISDQDGVTSQIERGDTGVTQTIQEPPTGTTRENLPAPAAAGAAELTPAQRANALSRTWFDHHQAQAPVLNAQRTFHGLRQIVTHAIEAGYTEEQVKEALRRIGEVLPSKPRFQRELAVAKGAPSTKQRRGYDDRQWDERAVAETANNTSPLDMQFGRLGDGA